MKACALTLIPLLLLTTAPSKSIAINPCLYNREDVLPCLDWFNAGVASPGPNQYTVHATGFLRGPNGLPICVKSIYGELLADIEDIGTPHLKFLYSPGAEQVPSINYPNQILQEFNVKCEPGRTAFIEYYDLFDLEPPNCLDGSTYKCRDYVDIDAGLEGGVEGCGNDSQPGLFTVASGEFIFKLRTSYSNSYPGFLIFVTCFNDEPETTTTAAETTTTAAETTTTAAETTTTASENTTTAAESPTTTAETTTTAAENTTTAAESTTTTAETTTTAAETTTTAAENTTTTDGTTTTAAENTTTTDGTTTTNEEIVTTTPAAESAAFVSNNLKSTSLEQNLSSVPTLTDTTSRKPLRRATLTKEEISTLRIMVKSLFRIALSQARRKITWPPKSFSKNDLEGFLSPDELSKLTSQSSVEPVTSLSLRTARSISSGGSKAEGVGIKRNIRPRRRTTSVTEVALEYSATLQAVKNENAVNPIIRTVAESYTTVAQRLAPQQLITARKEFALSISPKPVALDAL